MDAKLEAILDFLNSQQIRATYGAVADCLDAIPRAMGAMLGDKGPRQSFVVAADTELPSGYADAEKHPALESHPEIIRTCEELRRRMKAAGRPDLP